MRKYIDYIKYKYTENEKYFCINGWCLDKDNKIVYKVEINGKEINTEVVPFNRNDVLKKFEIQNEKCLPGFAIRVELEEELNHFKLTGYSSEESIVILDYNRKKLSQIKDQDEFDYEIEAFDIKDKKFTVIGWAKSNCKKEVDYKIVDSKGNEVPIELFRVVCQKQVLYKMLSENQINSGFVIHFKGDVNDKYKLIIKGKEEKIIDLNSVNNIFKRVIQNSHKITPTLIKQSLSYIRKNGIKKFMRRLKFNVPDQIIYHDWFMKHKVTKEELEKQRQKQFDYQPLISIIVATYNTKEEHFKEMVNSVLNQSYSNWELCIADGSTNSQVQDVYLKEYSNDTRILYKKLNENLGISGNMNAALEMSKGEYVGLFDHDDLLTPDALFEVVSVLQNKKYGFIYTDEDKIIDQTKKFDNPNFKPDINIDYLRNVNYICHFLVVNKELINKVGNFNSDFDGAQDYDFVLRLYENCEENNIYHIPKILYHWRMHAQSTAEKPESKLYAFEAGKRAIQTHIDRLRLKGTVSMGKSLGLYRVKYEVKDNPMVSVIIPNYEHVKDLDRCIKSILNKVTYTNYEIIVIENNSKKKETFDYYHKIEQKYKNIHIVYWKDKFNYSAINNFGVKFAKGEYFLLLNNDTEVINGDCFDEMLSYCQREDVGAVGALLFYPDNTIQHAGVIIGKGGIAGHAFIGSQKDDLGYFGRIVCTQELSAVTAACMMVKKEVYEQVNGFNEELEVAFNDIDFCMKIRRAGYHIVYNPNAKLYHFESKSRGLENTVEKVNRFNNEIKTFEKNWPEILEKGDPYYNINLSLREKDYIVGK